MGLKIERDDTAAQVVIKLLTDQVMAYLAIKVPLTALGIVNPIAAFFVGKVIKIVVLHTELGLKFFVIDKEVDGQVEDYTNAKQELTKAQEKGDANEIEKAKQAYIDKLKNLIKLKHN